MFSSPQPSANTRAPAMNDAQRTTTSDAATASGTMSCFSVFVDDLMFGIPVADTQSIFRVDNVTPVPLGPKQVAGLTNLRGRALAVVSLKSIFDGSTAHVAPGVLAIGLQVANEDYALVVDRVGEVMTVDTAGRMPVPPHFEAQRARKTEGLYKVGDDLLAVLNVRELFEFGTNDKERTA